MKKLFNPNGWLTLLFSAVTALMTYYIFRFEHTANPFDYICYLFSAYTVAVLIVKLVKVIKAFLLRNKYTARYMTNRNLRARIGIYTGFIGNTVFSVFYLISAIYYKSFWQGAIAVYYFVLTSTRLYLTRNIRLSIKTDKDTYLYELKTYRNCGIMLLLLTLAMSGMLYQMVMRNESYHYSGMLIYANAFYAFWCFVWAIINMIKFRNDNSPILSASKNLCFATALMSMIALQTAFFDVYDAGRFETQMNMTVGGIIFLIALMMSVIMIAKASKKIHQLSN